VLRVVAQISGLASAGNLIFPGREFNLAGQGIFRQGREIHYYALNRRGGCCLPLLHQKYYCAYSSKKTTDENSSCR
jgi:hypothetical protein